MQLNPRLLALPFTLYALLPAAGGQSLFELHQGAIAFDEFGFSVDCAGDVDGDGVDDWIIGAPDGPPGGSETGMARVHSGADGSLLLEFGGELPLDQFGWDVAGVGDVNGDGLDDLVITAPGRDFPGINTGGAYVFAGGSGNLLRTHFGDSGGENFGRAVASIADLNGDGISEYAIGGPGHGPGQGGGDPGHVSVYSGSDGALIHEWLGLQDSEYGEAIASVGDVDGDGFDDIGIGGPGFGAGFSDFGAVHVRSGATGAILHTYIGTHPNGRLGSAISALGDIDLDGYADFASSAPSHSGGRVFVYSGKQGSVLHTLSNGAEEDRFGAALAAPGDVNGDGIPDLLVGASFSAAAGPQSGAVSVISGADGKELHVYAGPTPSDMFGSSLAVGADLDGDGIGEWIAGSPKGHAGPANFGAALIYRGGNLLIGSYCEVALNSIGREALIGAVGVTSILDNEFALSVQDAIPGQAGIFFYGQGVTQVPFGDGWLCVGGALIRLNPPQAVGPLGDLLRPLDFGAPPANGGAGELQAGDTRYFQFWYRDPNGAGGSGFNLSDGLEVTFSP